MKLRIKAHTLMSWSIGLWELHLLGAESRAPAGGLERAKHIPGRENKAADVALNWFSPRVLMLCPSYTS